MNYNNTSENVECPICMECILDTKNKVTTECGHCFHTNCLMTSVAHNGFGCPYCRTAMAEAVDDDDDDGFDDSDWATSNSDEDDDRALRGFRFMFNGLAGESNDPEDNLEEDEDDEEEAAADEDEDDEDKPSPEYITQKLVEQGVSMSHLVKILLSAHEEYSNEESFDRIDDEIYGKLRIIISNYRPEPAVIQEQVVVPEVVVAAVLDSSAQPKSSNVTRRIMGRL